LLLPLTPGISVWYLLDIRHCGVMTSTNL
jgi:hypothetical protein